MNSEGNRPTSKGSITLAPVKATKNFVRIILIG